MGGLGGERRRAALRYAAELLGRQETSDRGRNLPCSLGSRASLHRFGHAVAQRRITHQFQDSPGQLVVKPLALVALVDQPARAVGGERFGVGALVVVGGKRIG